MDIESAVIERLRGQAALVNKTQLASLLGVTYATLQTSIRNGDVPEPESILGRPRWRPDALAEELDRRRKSPRMTRRQVARHLGVSDRTVVEWIKAGKFVDPDYETTAGRKRWMLETIQTWQRNATHGFKVGGKLS